jgi:hypothetical protein
MFSKMRGSSPLVWIDDITKSCNFITQFAGVMPLLALLYNNPVPRMA